MQEQWLTGELVHVCVSEREINQGGLDGVDLSDVAAADWLTQVGTAAYG